jgi:hypothetical protein
MTPKTKVRGHERGTLKGWKLVDEGKKGYEWNKPNGVTVKILDDRGYGLPKSYTKRERYEVALIRPRKQNLYKRTESKSQAFIYAYAYMRRHSKG